MTTLPTSFTAHVTFTPPTEPTGSRGGYRVNVLDFGAKGDGVADDTAAIIDAVAFAKSSGAKSVFFPAGAYLVTDEITIDSDVGIVGENLAGSRVLKGFDGDLFNFTGTDPARRGIVGVFDISLVESGQRDIGSFIKCRNNVMFYGINLWIGGGGNHIDYRGNWLNLSQVQMECYSGQPIKAACGGTWTNVYIRNSNLFSTRGVHPKPTIWLDGQVTSLHVSNSGIGGCGAPARVPISSISSAGTNINVTTPGPHGMAAGDVIHIEGTGVPAWDGTWQVDSATGTTLGILTGPITAGTVNNTGEVMLQKACVYMRSENGAINETTWTGVLFEGVNPPIGTNVDDGSVSVLMRSIGTSYEISNHSFNGCYFDIGQTGIRLIGQGFGAGSSSISGIHVMGGRFQALRRGIQVREASGITITGAAFNVPQHTADSRQYVGNCAIELDAYNAQQVRGVKITNSTLGRAMDYRSGTLPTNSYSYGIIMRYDVDDVIITGCDIMGLATPIALDSLVLNSKRIVIKDNTFSAGPHTPGVAGQVISVPTAQVVALPPYGEVFRLTGSATVDNFSGGWAGRKIEFFCDSPVVVGTIARQAGRVCTAVFDGAFWHV